MNIVDIKNLVPDIDNTDKTLNVFSKDASIFSVRPQVVVRPRSTQEIQYLVSYVSDRKKEGENISITARAAGTCMSGGPLNESIILDTTAYLNKFSIKGESADVEPGVFYRDFEKEAAKKDLLYPPYPASKDMCAFGGMIANNSGGEKSLTYGKTEDYVKEMDVVLSDGNQYHFQDLSLDELESKKNQNDFEGEIYRKVDGLISTNIDLINSSKPKVSKNSSGYAIWNVKKDGVFNLSNLFVGAQGTLGITTNTKIKLVKPHKYSSLLVVFMKDLDSLGNLVNTLSKFGPEDIESYDDKTLRLAIRFFPKILKRVGGGALSLLFSFLPELGLLLKGGLPKMVVITEFTGDSKAESLAKAKNAMEEVKRNYKLACRISRTEGESNKYRTIRRESFSLLRQSVGGRRAAPFIDDIIVKPEFLPQFLPELNKILDEYKDYMIYTISGHAGSGNFHIIPLMDLSDPKVKDIIFEVSDRVYELVFKYKGSTSGEHNDGIIRTPYVERMFGTQMNNLFKEIKDIFDSLNIFNPGKKVGGTIKYAKEHII